jgi:hypothetical protein
MDIDKFDELIKNNKELSKIFDGKFRTCMKNANNWEKSTNIDFYKNNFCLKKSKTGIREDTVKSSVENLVKCCVSNNIKLKEDDIHKVIKIIDFQQCCVLPKNHDGKCCNNLPWTKIMKKNTNNHITMLGWVGSTPGNDGHIYKNRASRIFPIRLSYDVGKKLKNKEVKYKCAIPLKDSSTPLMLATCYIDITSYLLRVRHFDELYLTTISEHDKQIMHVYYKTHFLYLKNYYEELNRYLYKDNNTHTRCCVTGHLIDVKDLIKDVTDDESIQFGHVEPISEINIMTKGQNVVLMTRRGNLILGNNNFLEDVWLNNLDRILKYNNYFKD